MTEHDVAAVLARFPGAVIAEVRRHTPGAAVPVTEKVTFQDLWSAAESERQRADATRAWHVDQIAERGASLSPVERDSHARLAADRGRAAEVFEAMARMIERVRDSRVIRDELAYIARTIAAEAADRAADADGEERAT